ncbi:MAG: DUF2155 domain-containing protein [Pseudomonadota bacterium]
MKTILAGACAAAVLFAATAGAASAETVVLRALDKTYGIAKDIAIPVGKPMKFGSLTITPKACAKRAPEETPEVSAFLTIDDKPVTDANQPAAEPKTIFSGWMFASSPALNALEHPSYDVWVIDCRS